MRATSFHDFEQCLDRDTDPPDGGIPDLPTGGRLRVVWTDRRDTFEAIASQGLWAGDRGNCSNRKQVRLQYGQPPTKRRFGVAYIHPTPGKAGEWDGLWTPNMSVPCRKCADCRRTTQRMWERRSKAEFSAAERSWFLTLTFDPKLRPLDTHEDQWRFARSQLTLYLKRVRATGATFRYLAGFEAHQSGRPHIHLLLHETGGKITRRTLGSNVGPHSDRRGCWHDGFVAAKLIKTPSAGTAARYICAYLHKARDLGECRIRASLHYGKPELGTDAKETSTDEVHAPEGSPEATAPPPLPPAEAGYLHPVRYANEDSSSHAQERGSDRPAGPDPPDRWEQFAVQLISTMAPALRTYRRKPGDPEPSRKRWRKGDYSAFLTE